MKATEIYKCLFDIAYLDAGGIVEESVIQGDESTMIERFRETECSSALTGHELT